MKKVVRFDIPRPRNQVHISCCKMVFVCVFIGNGHYGGGSWEGSLLLDRVAQRDSRKMKRKERNAITP